MGHLLKLVCVCLCIILFLSGCADGVRVRRGDTLYSISRKNDVPMRAIIEENNLRPPYTLHPGQYLSFPTVRHHKVRKGDTLYSIARRYDMSVSSLARVNKLHSPYRIHVGDVLRISSWTGDTESVASTSSRSARYHNKNQSRSSYSRKKVKNPNAFKGNAQVPWSQRNKRFIRPVSGRIISDFGPGNDGINIAAKSGTPVKAADGGKVAYAGNELKGYGYMILIRHSNGWITAYAHNRKLWVKKGQTVQKGQKIAEVGQTGSVKTPQLHFEVRYKAKVANPHHYMR